MKNPFEAIRKLASSKLKHFKFMITIVMYLAAIIPLISLGYLMGRTSSESSKWLLDLSSLLGAFGSLLGGLATVFAAWVAFGAYGAWKKQVTHPEVFKNDCETVEYINEITNRISNAKADYKNFLILSVKDFYKEVESNPHDDFSEIRLSHKVGKHINQLVGENVLSTWESSELYNIINSRGLLCFENRNESIQYKLLFEYYSLFDIYVKSLLFLINNASVKGRETELSFLGFPISSYADLIHVIIEMQEKLLVKRDEIKDFYKRKWEL